MPRLVLANNTSESPVDFILILSIIVPNMRIINHRKAGILRVLRIYQQETVESYVSRLITLYGELWY